MKECNEQKSDKSMAYWYIVRVPNHSGSLLIVSCPLTHASEVTLKTILHKQLTYVTWWLSIHNCIPVIPVSQNSLAAGAQLSCTKFSIYHRAAKVWRRWRKGIIF